MPKRSNLITLLAFGIVGATAVAFALPAASSSMSSGSRIERASLRSADAAEQQTMTPTTVASATPLGERDRSLQAEANAKALLRAPDRTRFALCVDGAGVSIGARDEAIQSIRQALPRVTGSPRWAASSLSTQSVQVDAGCPTSPAVFGGQPLFHDVVINRGQAKVDKASPYVVYVYVIPNNKLNEYRKGTESVRTATQEMLCSGSVCWEVTTALYISASEAANMAFVQDWLLKSIGLDDNQAPVKPTVPPVGR